LPKSQLPLIKKFEKGVHVFGSLILRLIGVINKPPCLSGEIVRGRASRCRLVLSLECAPAWTVLSIELTRPAGLAEGEAMTKHRSHSTAFKPQVAEEFIAGETLHGFAKISA
jgi:hypothetical protein